MLFYRVNRQMLASVASSKGLLRVAHKITDSFDTDRLLEYVRFHGVLLLRVEYPSSGRASVVAFFCPKSEPGHCYVIAFDQGEYPTAIPWSAILPVLVSLVVLRGWQIEKEVNNG